MAGAYDRLKKLIEQEEEQKGKRRSGSYGETPANRGSRAAHGELTESGSTEYRGKRYARPAEGAQEKKTAPWERAVSKAMTAAGTQKRRQEEAARETGGLTPALEARYQQANGVNRAPSAYQTYMMRQVNAQPRQAETRSTDELRRDMNRQNRIAAGTNRMAADMGNRMTQDQSLIYNPTYTSNLRTMGQTMVAQHEKANQATALYQTLSVQRREQEERAKVLEMMKNPDFLKNSQGNVAIADGGMAVSTGSDSKARLYRDIYYRGTSGIDGKGVTDSAARNVTDEEAAVFFYIWNTQTPEAAERFYKDYLENRAGERQMGKIQTQAQAYGEYDPLGASVLSVGTNVLSGVGLVDMAWQNIARSVGITDKNKPLNYCSPAQSFSLKTDALRQGASNFLEQAAVDEIKRIHPNVKHPENYAKVAGFLYQTGMSMADSSVAVALNLMGIPEPLTLAMMGSAAGTRAIREARERGATDGQALAFGISSAIMEALFEKISLDRILTESDAHNLAQSILETLKQGFTEGSEEVMTTLANTAADMLIMGDKAEVFETQRRLMEQGVSEKEALKAALSQWGTGILGDAIGGFLSGSVMSGGKEYANARTNPLYQWNMPMSAARALNDIERSGLRRDRGNAEMTPPLPGSMQRNAQGEVTPNVETAGQEGLRYNILEGGDEQGKNDALNAAYQKANTAERSVEISKKLLDKYREISNNPLQKLVNVVKEFYDQNLKGRKATVNVNGRTLEISFENDGKKKSVGWRMNTDKAASFEKLYELTQNAEYAYSERNRDPNEATSVPIFHYFVGNIRMANETGNYQNVPVKIQVRDVVTSADEKETHYYTHNLDRRIAGSDSPVAGAQSPNIDSNAYTPAIERNVSQFVSSVNTPPLPTGRITTQKKRGRTAYQAYLDRYDEAVSLRLTAGPAERDTVWTRYLRRQEEELRAKALKTVEILGYVPEEYAGLLDEEPGTPSLAALAHHQNQRRNSDAEEHLHSESEEESVDKSGEDSIINHEPNIVNKVDTGKHRNENALTKSQLHEAIKWARKHGYNCDIEYSDYCSTAFIGYSDGACLLVIGTDALPSDAPRTANEAISLHGAIVHEVVGHYEAWLKGTSKSNEALEEAQASIRAAKFGLDLSEYERTLLYEDAMDRLANAGISFEKVKDQLDIWER